MVEDRRERVAVAIRADAAIIWPVVLTGRRQSKHNRLSGTARAIRPRSFNNATPRRSAIGSTMCSMTWLAMIASKEPNAIASRADPRSEPGRPPRLSIARRWEAYCIWRGVLADRCDRRSSSAPSVALRSNRTKTGPDFEDPRDPRFKPPQQRFVPIHWFGPFRAAARNRCRNTRTEF